MLRRFLIIFLASLVIPAYAGYSPISNEEIKTPQDFYGESEEAESPEFEYPNTTTSEEAPPVKVQPTKNYVQIYNDMQPADFSYLHNIDPDQYYDIKDTSWIPYPLLRLNSYIYFKGTAIEPGYYLLTPREHKGKWYLLFKQNGIVKHIIPTYDRSITPEMFYDEHIPKPKLTKAQEIHMGTLSFLGKFKSTKRKDPIKSYMEINDLENYFVSIIIYYGNHKYSTIFRTIKL